VKLEGFWKHFILVAMGVAVLVYSAIFLADDQAMMGKCIAGAGLLLAAGDPRKLLKLAKTGLPIWQHALFFVLGASCMVIAVKLKSSALAKDSFLATGGLCLLAGDPWHLFSGVLGGSDDQAPPAPPASGASAGAA
jgi:hypothetical protein